ncbi:hypothetical protein TNCV_3259051 [Trichonephila clavipes]|nr:hypothetical protein TNCV_3259051 [Trichonephila clavipes]
MTKSSGGKQTSISLKMKMELLKTVDRKQNTKTEIYSNDENEMNISAPVSTSSEMKKVMKGMCSLLDPHSKGEMNNKMNDIEQSVDNLMLKKQ